jgi:hypothetical protein
VQPEGNEKRDEKDRKAGCRVMKTNCLSPMSVIIGFRNNRKDGWEIRTRDKAKKKKEDMGSGIALRPLKSNENKASPHKPKDHGFLISPNGSKPSCDQKGEAVTYGEGGKEATGCPMGNRKVILNQREEGGEYSACGKVKKPETPEDEEREKFHLFHSFQTRMALRWSFLLLLIPFQDIFIEESIFQTDGIDDTVDDHCPLPFFCPIKMFNPQTILLPQMSQRGFIKRKDLSSQFSKGFFHNNSLISFEFGVQSNPLVSPNYELLTFT